MKKYDVVAFTKDIVGTAEEKSDGTIIAEINNREYTLEEQIKNGSWEKITSPIKKEIDSSILVNEITKEVQKTYPHTKFKKATIKELSLLLNDSYLTAFTSNGLKRFFHPILEKEYGKISKTRMATHLRYFVIEGRLHESEQGFYEIKKSNLIPKQKKKEENLGILDELDL